MCKYIVFGFETCPNSKALHLQGYIYFGSGVKYSMIKTMSLFKDICKELKLWLSIRYHGINRAINYCKKGEQPKSEWQSHKELGPKWGT